MEREQLMELPVDTLVDILLRLPLKDVACVKCVSKTLSRIVSDISFSKFHARLWPPADQVPRLLYCSSTENLLTLQSLNYKDNILTKGRSSITVSSSSDRYFVHFVFHNIFCLGFSSSTDCMLVNVLGERGVLRLPECSFSREKNTGIKSMSWFGMGFDDKTNTYKIVCVTHDRGVDRGRHTSTTASVLELGTNSWRQITSLPPCDLNLINNDVVCANGAAHWLTGVTERDDERIVSFDFRKEEFCWTPIPTFQSPKEYCWDSYSNLKLFCLKGCLAIVGTTRSCWSFSSADMMNIEIWVLKDSDQQEKLWEIYYNNKIPDCFPADHFYDPPGEWEHGIFYTLYNGSKTSVLFIDLKCGSVNGVLYPLTAPASSTSNGEEDL